uniref:hypothetical protein n=1 Tax=Rhodaphanes brevistipitata TaxID=446136 RepID=UPI001FCDACCC|nr:hypothetical protein MW432_pgp092 [Rhodaphanes brevistipitata]UNJ18489.1 hypothetical protein [Rhodaphanes brevistipitata]
MLESHFSPDSSLTQNLDQSLDPNLEASLEPFETSYLFKDEVGANGLQLFYQDLLQIRTSVRHLSRSKETFESLQDELKYLISLRGDLPEELIQKYIQQDQNGDNQIFCSSSNTELQVNLGALKYNLIRYSVGPDVMWKIKGLVVESKSIDFKFSSNPSSTDISILLEETILSGNFRDFIRSITMILTQLQGLTEEQFKSVLNLRSQEIVQSFPPMLKTPVVYIVETLKVILKNHTTLKKMDSQFKIDRNKYISTLTHNASDAKSKTINISNTLSNSNTPNIHNQHNQVVNLFQNQMFEIYQKCESFQNQEESKRSQLKMVSVINNTLSIISSVTMAFLVFKNYNQKYINIENLPEASPFSNRLMKDDRTLEIERRITQKTGISRNSGNSVISTLFKGGLVLVGAGSVGSTLVRSRLGNFLIKSSAFLALSDIKKIADDLNKNLNVQSN